MAEIPIHIFIFLVRNQSRKELAPWRLCVPLRLVQTLHVHPCTWGHGKTAQPPQSLTPRWSVDPISFPSSGWARLTLLFNIISLCFKQQPGSWSTGWGCGRHEFNTLLTLRGSIKHFPMLQKTAELWEHFLKWATVLSPVETVCSHTGMSLGQVPLQVCGFSLASSFLASQ